ncbi:MAG: class A sortase [Tissierellia bacterium]|nr:class A sortase [Tissierellia bacterium]
MKKIIAVSLIIIGLLLVGYQLGSDYLFKQSQKTEYIKEITAEDMAQNEKKEVVNDYEAITNIDALDSYKMIDREFPEFVIAQLIIPSMQRNLAVSKGVNVENLWVGVATMKLEQKLGEGNYTISGHNHRIEGSLFHGLEHLGIGEDIYITDKVNIYHYRTYANLTTEPDAFYLLDDEIAKEHGKPILSLMTCARPISEDKRIFIQAEFINKFEYTPELFDSLYSGDAKLKNINP